MNGYQYPEETGKKLISTLLQRQMCLEKQNDVQELEKRIGGPRVSYKHIASSIERDKRQKLEEKKAVEKRIRSLDLNSVKKEQEELNFVVKKEENVNEMHIDHYYGFKPLDSLESQSLENDSKTKKKRKRLEEGELEVMEGSSSSLNVLDSINQVENTPVDNRNIQKDSESLKDTLLVKGFNTRIPLKTAQQLFCKFGIFLEIKMDSNGRCCLLKVSNCHFIEFCIMF